MMSSLPITNLKRPETNVDVVKRCNSAPESRKKDKISEFFERHETTRKIGAYLPTIVIGGAFLIEKTTSHKLLSDIGIVAGIALTTMWFFSGFAQDSKRALQNKKTERLNP